MSLISLLLVVMLVILPLAGCLEGPTPSRESVTIAGVGNASWAPIVPMSRATFVEYDPDAYNDDLAYLAALPTTIFAEGDAVYASPLLFYRDQGVASSPEERALNDTQGIHYLMEDWLAVNGHGLGRVDIIGSAPYEGDETVTYGTDPIATSAALALDNWKYSREAVVVPVDPRVSDTFETVSGEVRGILDEGEIVEYRFSGSKLPDPVKPDRYTFDVDEGHYYVDAYLNWTWAGQTVAPDGSAATERGKDLDLQLYDGALGEVAASEVWNVIQGNLERPFQPPYERCLSLVFHTGKWEATVTYMPTKSIGPAAGPTSEDSRAYYNILVKVYPGVVVDIPDEVRALGAGARFVLSGGGNLGLVLIGPAGEEVASVMDGSDPKTLDLSSIGTGRYRVAVISLDGSGGVFTVTYSWEDTRKPVTAHMLASAAVGAVYASLRNIPLIYVGMGSVPSSARRALDRLGTERVHLFNLGDYSGVASKLDYRSWDEPRLEVDEVTSYPEAYRMIRSISGSNDVVFTTVTGWQHWYPGSDGPEGVDPRGTSVGPAAYAAAAHGAPVLVTDVHPEISGPAAWHSNYWIQAYPNRMPPGVGSMVLTGRMVYDLLGELGLDGEGKEDIITVAGHLNIGQAWDRTFVGVANPGRIAGTPVDQSVWVCRNALYPALIFANPAVNTDVDPHGTLRITGSRSVAPGVIDEPEHEVEAPFVVAQTWVSYQHRFNERASKYWGTSYVGPSGVSPYWTESGDPIDEGNTNYPGERGEGRYYPDMTTSEVV
ncbi:MAG TPA: hypothetical protein EYP43_04690, partial [Thermoplasmata archaeon]|nr:hypothetical protein [Thermoplasmata archaeon]